MPVDGAGNFTRSYNWTNDKAAAIKINATRMDGEFDNYAAALNQNFWRSGVAAMTGNINMGSNALTALADGVVALPAVRFFTEATTGLWLNGAGKLAFSVAGTQRFELGTAGARIMGTGILDISAQDGVNEGGEIKLRGAPGGAVDWNVDISTSSLRFFTTDKGLQSGHVDRVTIDSAGAMRVTGNSAASQLAYGTALNWIDNISTDGGVFATRLFGSNSTVWQLGTAQNVPLQLLTNNAISMHIDVSGNVAVGSTGGDFTRTWRGVFVKAQNATTQVGVGNTTSGASAKAQFSAFGATANSWYDDALVDNSGTPYHSVNHGTTVTDFRIDFNGVTALKIASAGVLSGFVTATDSAGNDLGYRDIPQVALAAGTRTVALTDRNKHIYATSTAAGLSIPLNATTAFPIGTAIMYINMTAGNTTITPVGGVSLIWAPTGVTGVRTVSQYGMVTIVKTGTNEWFISGSGIT